MTRRGFMFLVTKLLDASIVFSEFELIGIDFSRSELSSVSCRDNDE